MKKCFIKYLKKIQALQVEVAGKGSFHVESYKFLNTEDDKEVIDYLNDKLSLEDCKELIKKRTRNYAKRQVTFFKNQFELEMFESKEQLLERYGK